MPGIDKTAGCLVLEPAAARSRYFAHFPIHAATPTPNTTSI
jgi:hypothetical protein